MNRRMIIISLLLVATILMSGCVEESSVVVNYNTTVFSVGSNVTATEIIEESTYIGTNLIVTGRVVEIRFRSGGGDIIVFEDGYVIATNSAEKFTWKIGEISRIVIRKDPLNQVGNILKVENIEVTDK